MKLTFAAIVVADVLDRLPDDALIVDLGLGCDLPGDHDHPRLGHCLACNLQTHNQWRWNKSTCSFLKKSHLAVRVLSEVGVQDGVGDLVAHFVCNM